MGADRSAELEEPLDGVSYCARHPQVETYLTCGRCGTPICPRCMVQTPVGARCPECANVRRLPTIEVTPAYFARGVAAALLTGAACGAIWGAIKPPFGFSLLFGLILGLALGWAISEAVGLATNKKRGLGLQVAAVGGVAVAFLVQDMFAGSTPFGPRSFILESDLVLAGVAALFAITRLRVG